VLNDLDRITSQPEGGNYAAAAVIVCAYDALADLRDGARNAGNRPFRDTLPPRWKPVAASLYDALRNGLVHGYETQRILVDGRDIELAVAWQSGRHLTVADGHVVLAVPDLADGLRQAFDLFEAALRMDAQLRDRFQQRFRRGRVREVHNPGERAAWRALLPSH
jgi:hypothetical protein